MVARMSKKYNAKSRQIQTRASSKKTRPSLRDRYEGGGESALDPFIGWDSEGYDGFVADSSGCVFQRHNTMLFGCRDSYGSVVDRPLIGPRLSTLDMLGYLIEIRNKYPDAIHIAFAFDYDVNQILQDLPPRNRQMLIRNGRCQYKGYRIEHIPRKIFVVHPPYPWLKPITIYDIFPFFNCSYLSALDAFEIGDPDVIEAIGIGKSRRGRFTYADIEFVRRYWEQEISYLPLLGNSIRDTCYRSRFYITKWYGPGAIASYMLKANKAHLRMLKYNPVYYDQKSGRATKKLTSAYRLARKTAYAGGRFSQFGAGVFYGPVYTADLNSAYVAAMRQLPSLATGEWIHRGPECRDNVVDFAMYRIRFDTGTNGYPGGNKSNVPYPLFRRTKRGMDWPCQVEGWYWGPEAKTVARDPRASFLECFEWSNPTPVFGWVEDYYKIRQALKKAENPAERTYKWGLASMYGLCARRVGWNQQSRTAPSSHQLEWAGFITSWCRAQMQTLALTIGDGLVSIDTDGITSLTPFASSLPVGTGLGEWKIEEFQGLVQWQNGVYWLLDQDGEWQIKSRGLQRGTIPRELAERTIMEMEERLTVPYEQWNPGIDSREDLIGPLESPGASRRFSGRYRQWMSQCSVTVDRTTYVGYRQAMVGFNEDRWRQWETKEHTLSLGAGAHHHHYCHRCNRIRGGGSLDEYPLHTISQFHRDEFADLSEPHRLPWEEEAVAYDDPEGATMYEYNDPFDPDQEPLIFPDYNLRDW